MLNRVIAVSSTQLGYTPLKQFHLCIIGTGATSTQLGTCSPPSLKCTLFLLYFDYFDGKIINKYKNVVPYSYCILKNIRIYLRI